MKQMVFFILLFSLTFAFAQTKQPTTSSVKVDDQKGDVAVKTQKVSEIRHVVIKGNVQMAKDIQNRKQIKYDEKGGIIIPNASKGIRQTHLTPDQKKLVSQVERAKRQGIQTKAKSERNDIILQKQTTKKPKKESEAQKKRNE